MTSRHRWAPTERSTALLWVLNYKQGRYYLFWGLAAAMSLGLYFFDFEFHTIERDPVFNPFF